MKKGMVLYMRDQMKRRVTKGKYVLLTLIILGAGFFLLFGDSTHAADQIFITFNGEDLNPAETYDLRTKTMQLMLRTEGTAYDADQYKVEWTIEDVAARDIATVTQSEHNKMIATVTALSPGDVTVTVTVKDSMNGDAVLGATSCNIHVLFSIDTTGNDAIFKYVHEEDEMRSLVLYADDPEVDLSLNFGSADSTNTQWMSSNEEIVTVGQRNGKVTPVGSGKTQVTATYTPTGSTITYTAYLDVYVIPQVSATAGGPYQKSLSAQIYSGEYLYTDTDFSNNLEVVQSKITWVIKKDDSSGRSVTIADSLGKQSDLISIAPTASRTNELRVQGLAGEYDVYFYTYGSYDENVENGTISYTPTVLHLTIKSDIKDQSRILNIGDIHNFAEHYNMTTEDFNDCFSVAVKMKEGAPDYAEYADYNTASGELTAKRVGELVATLTVKSGKGAYLKRLMGLEVDAVLPASFITNISITDNIQLNRTSMTIVVGQKEQLSVKLNSTYTGSVTWESENSSYVKVNESGLVEGVKVTTADVIVRATLDAGNGLYKTAECTVKVEATVTDFTLSPDGDQMMLPGEHLTVVAGIKQTVTVAPLQWFSSDNSILSVEQAADRKSAILTAGKGGEATLTVFNTVNNSYKAFKVTVRVPINQITFKSPNLSVEYYKGGFNMKREVTWGPNNATDTDLVWSSADTSIVALDSDGYMTLTGPGTTLVSVYPKYNPYNVMASCLVTVIGTPDKMFLSATDVTLNVGSRATVDVEFEPENTTTGITWTPVDPSLFDLVYDEGRRIVTLTGKKPGTTNINVVTTEGLISNIKVTVMQPSTALNLKPKELTLRTGDSADLTPEFTPADSTDTVEWKSYNTGVATVDNKGRVTGVKSGTTFIQATAYNGKIAGPTSVIQVVVRDGVKGISLDSAEKTIREGDSVILSPVFNPDTAFDKGMTWTASNGNVKLEPGETDVNVIGVKAGTALIIGTTSDGGYSVSCLITVLPKVVVVPKNTKVVVSPTSKFLKVGKSFYVTATVTGTSNKKVKWTSSKKSVATVTSDGKVKGKKIGTAYIKATARDGSGAFAQCKVRVVRKVKKIKLNRYSGRLLVGNTMKLKATVTPKNATIKSVRWTTNKKSIATVSSSGRVLGVGEGIVKIKATAKDGSGKSATCIIRVTEPIEATGVTVANSQITVAKGKIAQSGITLNPVNSTTKIKYRSDNPKVATVNKYGKIKTKRAGEATIYGTTSTGLYGYCDVLVVDMKRKAMTIRPYDTEQLAVNEISEGVTWYSKDINIATVSSTGLVTGRKKGTTTVYAVVNGVKLGCRVTVKKLK